MKIIFFGSVLIFLSLQGLAQSRWGFALTIVFSEDQKGKSTKYVFISDVVDMTTLDCKQNQQTSDLNVSDNKIRFYERCLNSWFFRKASAFEHKLADQITEKEVIGFVQNVSGRIDPECEVDELACFYLNKDQAEKVRRIHIRAGRRGGEKIIEVH